jgi:hypothetical protein
MAKIELKIEQVGMVKEALDNDQGIHKLPLSNDESSSSPLHASDYVSHENLLGSHSESGSEPVTDTARANSENFSPTAKSWGRSFLAIGFLEHYGVQKYEEVLTNVIHGLCDTEHE